jgi:hypothetical protein
MTGHTRRERFGEALSRTRTATGMTVHRRDTLAVLLLSTVAYLLVYLYALGHLAPGLGGFGMTVVQDPLSKLLRPELGPLQFTTIAQVRVGPITYLFSLNTILGLGLSILVGLNFALTYMAWRQPKACGLGESGLSVPVAHRRADAAGQSGAGWPPGQPAGDNRVTHSSTASTPDTTNRAPSASVSTLISQP